MNRSKVENPRLMIENVENGIINNMDYISSLPDDIISHILSRLRAKSTVQTCVLSKAWEYKWTTIYDIEIDDEECFSNNEKKLAFVNFVDRILFHSQNFKRVHLDSWEVYEDSRVRAWLSIVFRRNVEKVTIHAFYRGSLPMSLLNCTSLRELEIKAQCYWKTPVNNRFPNLKSIFLREVHFVSEISEPGLPLPKFDELEKLYISPSREIWKYIKGLFEGLFELLRSAPLLKSLHISLCDAGKMDSDAYKDNDYNVMESVPSCVVSHLLEVRFIFFKSEIHQFRLLKFFLKNGAQLHKLIFHCNDELEKVETEEQLLKFPKDSTRLKVVFT